MLDKCLCDIATEFSLAHDNCKCSVYLWNIDGCNYYFHAIEMGEHNNLDSIDVIYNNYGEPIAYGFSHR